MENLKTEKHTPLKYATRVLAFLALPYQKARYHTALYMHSFTYNNDVKVWIPNYGEYTLDSNLVMINE